MELVTTDTILSYLHDSVARKKILDKHTWVDAALKLTALLGDEHDKLFTLESSVAKSRAKLLSEENMSVAKADAFIEASDEYNSLRRQKARIGQIEEFIRIAKVQAKLKDFEEKNY